jgi:hypothetical protein
VFWFRNKQQVEQRDFAENLRKKGIIDEDIPELVEVKEDTALVVYSVPMGKKRTVEFIPKTKSFIARWYSSFLTNPMIQQPPLGRFLSSLYVPNSKESSSVMNKFLLYLLRDEVAGILLEQLLTMKTEGISKAIRPLSHAKFFFSKLG